MKEEQVDKSSGEDFKYLYSTSKVLIPILLIEIIVGLVMFKELIKLAIIPQSIILIMIISIHIMAHYRTRYLNWNQKVICGVLSPFVKSPETSVINNWYETGAKLTIPMWGKLVPILAKVFTIIFTIGFLLLLGLHLGGVFDNVTFN